MVLDKKKIDQAKIAAAKAAMQFVKDGMILGLGSGSTAEHFIEILSSYHQDGLRIECVPTSTRSETKARQLGLPVISGNDIIEIDLTIDGADEVDQQKSLIKGGGGALLREKIIAETSQQFIVIVDETKLVKQLGKFPLPLEISSFAHHSTLRRLKEQGYLPTLRMKDASSPYLTDNGNFIVDLKFKEGIADPIKENSRLKEIAGVLETGLFCRLAKLIVIGYVNGESALME